MIRALDKIEDNDVSASRLVNDATARVFAKGGFLQTVLDLEHRPQQEAMALRTCQAIGEDQGLLFEAGTGVGKSLAYLVPGIFFAMEAKRPCVVATHTIALQEQILKNDLPLCRSLFEKSPALHGYRDFQATLLAGKANYLCSTRLAEALKNRGQVELFENEERVELQRIARWASENARDGMRQELSPRPNAEIWERVNADSSLCSRKRCDLETCFYQKARERVFQADLIVVNHSLLFALLGAGVGPQTDSKGILFADDFLVLDEAHRVPKVATDHFGATLGSYAVSLTLRRLHDPRKKKGLLAMWGDPGDKGLVHEALEAADGLFYHLRENILRGQDTRRVLEPNALPSDFLPPFHRLIERLRFLVNELGDKPPAVELKDQCERLELISSAFRDFQEMKDAENVYWVEKYGKRSAHSQLRIVPIDPAPMLKEALFCRGVSAILTSATLQQGGRMDRFRNLVGAEEVDAVAEDSPFDYKQNLKVFVARDCPEPRLPKRDPYLAHLSELIFRCAQQEKGGSLALFTNFADLRHVADAIGSRWQKEGRALFVHGSVLSRSELRRRFAEAGNGLLLGAESFWMGIDVPGPALSQVIVTRLPFENPNHPVAEAKAERIRKAGHSTFYKLTIPEALSRFRQGIGRLIRNKNDRGLITILDSRILRKTYGKHFISELPKQDFRVFTLQSFVDDFVPWIRF